MTDKERNIYSQIYDITQENLQKSGLSMSTHKETLMASLNLRPDATDLSLMYDIPRDKYIQALFYLTFKRWPADDETEKMDDGSLDDEEFKKTALKSVYESTERRIKKSVVYNYVDYTNEYTYSIGKFRRRVRMTMTKIKAKIPLKTKIFLKDIVNKILRR